MPMAASEAVLQVLSGALPCLNKYELYSSHSNSACLFKPDVTFGRKRAMGYMRVHHASGMLGTRMLFRAVCRTDCIFTAKTGIKRLDSLSCECLPTESFSGIRAENTEPASLPATGMQDELKNQKLHLDQQLKHGKEVLPPKSKLDGSGMIMDAVQKACAKSIEEEAWDLLRESIVYYCGNPIGTIAANDPSSTSILNYDQIFIRDFIPSGIAFLLKGEYDIVRNFILYTLQLQSWEKTIDCHSPGQGLMPASFKVRTVALDGDDSVTEEVLDPDFGEAAIGRVAPVDSGLWWIILLRAYGKCSGDLSVQERVDVQTGIKMILKLCLADGFDMFPTLLVTDGSCMIDRRMGIHGHPLEIQIKERPQIVFYAPKKLIMGIKQKDEKDLVTSLSTSVIKLQCAD